MQSCAISQPSVPVPHSQNSVPPYSHIPSLSHAHTLPIPCPTHIHIHVHIPFTHPIPYPAPIHVHITSHPVPCIHTHTRTHPILSPSRTLPGLPPPPPPLSPPSRGHPGPGSSSLSRFMGRARIFTQPSSTSSTWGAAPSTKRELRHKTAE